jgi:hypothetical protein
LADPSLGAALRAHTPDLLRVEGVVGTAEGLGEDGVPCILVLVRERTAEILRRVPSRLGGHPVRLRVVGPLEAREP